MHTRAHTPDFYLGTARIPEGMVADSWKTPQPSDHLLSVSLATLPPHTATMGFLELEDQNPGNCASLN